MSDRANAAIADDGVQAAQRLQLNSARGSAASNASRRRAVEHHHDRAMMGSESARDPRHEPIILAG
jgi:hypothetical protein